MDEDPKAKVGEACSETMGSGLPFTPTVVRGICCISPDSLSALNWKISLGTQINYMP